MRKLEVGQVSTTVPSAARRLSAKSCRRPHRFEARGIVCAVNERIAGTGREAAALLHQGLVIDRNAEFFQCVLVLQIIGNLSQALADRLFLVSLGPAGHGDLRVEPKRSAVPQAQRTQLPGFVAPAHRAFERFVEVHLADVIGHVEDALRAQLVVAAQTAEEGAGARGRIALLKVAEVEADYCGDQILVFVEQSLNQLVTFERCPSAAG